MKIKLFSMFIAMALLVTVGGVYATWTYASNEATVQELTSDVTVDVQINATQSGAVGTITSGANPFAIIIGEKVPNPTNIEDYIATITPIQQHADGTDGGLMIYFTPSENAPAIYKDSVTLQVKIDIADGSAIMTNVAGGVLTLDASSFGYNKDTSDPNRPVFSWELDIDDLELAFVDAWAGANAYETQAIEEYSEYLQLVEALGKDVDSGNIDSGKWPTLTISLVME